MINRLYLLLLFCVFSLDMIAQKDRESLFMQYEARFGLCGYPFVFSNDYVKMTKPEVYPNALPEDMLQEFIYTQGIKPFAFFVLWKRSEGMIRTLSFHERTISIYLLYVQISNRVVVMRLIC